nr:hypothetical protein [Tawny frogmouth aviadenovirus A]
MRGVSFTSCLESSILYGEKVSDSKTESKMNTHSSNRKALGTYGLLGKSRKLSAEGLHLLRGSSPMYAWGSTWQVSYTFYRGFPPR